MKIKEIVDMRRDELHGALDRECENTIDGWPVKCVPQHTGGGEIVCKYCGRPMSFKPENSNE